MRFADIPGLDSIKEKLIRSVRENKIAHAQLFAGKPGALNLPMALAFNTYIHCLDKKENDACGQCHACSKNLKYIHPDVTFVFPLANLTGDKDEDRFRADILKSWRQFLLEKPFGDADAWAAFYGAEDKQPLISREESREIVKALSLKPFESRFKVMLIWQPEYMHPAAANGILKILEEPPPQTIFLLVTNAFDQLMATILSRTQMVQVPLLPDETLAAYLRDNHAISGSKNDKIVQQVEGNLHAALQWTDEEGEDDSSTFFFDWMMACFNANYGEVVSMADTFHEADRQRQRHVVAHALGMMREALLHRAGAAAISRVKGHEQQRIQRLSARLHAFQLDVITRLLNEALFHLERNGSAKMIFTDLSIRLGRVIRSAGEA
ncbi:MAG: DNA polymerase III subunit delta [Cyclobacteriaceae bacterium]|jgi:DNA polymerase-3 subunit delta'|nr:DNA polymerase III subunit delta [Cyclobacteriaceae bacterium]